MSHVLSRYGRDFRRRSRERPSSLRPYRLNGPNSDRLFLSTLTVAEIADGIATARREGARRKSTRPVEWLDAGTALTPDLTLLTANLGHFKPLKIDLQKPFEVLPKN